MIGIDTTFLIAAVHEEHPRHPEVADLMSRWITADERLGLCSQVVAEFLHVVTDSRRFERPMTMQEALRQVDDWLLAEESAWFSTGDDVILLAMQWMSQFQLGRKRILDTLIAATYASQDVGRLATLNAADFLIFDVFDFLPSADA